MKSSYTVWNRSEGRVEEVPIFDAARLDFYFRRPVGRFLMRGPYSWPILSRLQTIGRYLPGSRREIQPFIERYEIPVDEILGPLEDFETFNDFFIRRLQPWARPVCEAADVVSAPCDGQVLVFEDVGMETRFTIKGVEFTLPRLLGDKSLAEQFRHGSLASIYLAPYDYHRFHYPVDGRLVSQKKLGHRLFAVNPEVSIANGFRPFDVNVRLVNLFESESYGTMAMVEVGAYLVGRIVETDAGLGDKRKGDEKGYFAYGGSSVLLAFQESALCFDADLVEQSARALACRIRMGEQIGTLSGG